MSSNNTTDNTQILEKIEETHQSEGRFGGEVHLSFQVQKGEDQYGQERVVWRRKKDLDCGSRMATKTEEKVFKNYDQLVKFLEDKWYDAVVAKFLAEDIGDAVGFEAEQIMYPVDRMSKKLNRELDEISMRQARKMAIEWMEDEHPEHFANNEEEGAEQ